MSARLLAVVPEGQEAAALAAMPALAAIARAETAQVRLACVRALPPPRTDRFDRVVADVDREMARIGRTLVETFTWAARRFDDVTMEVVVRFGHARDEVMIETEVFAPTLVSVFAPREAGILTHIATWALRRRIARGTDARVIVLETERPRAATRGRMGTPPRTYDIVRI